MRFFQAVLIALTALVAPVSAKLIDASSASEEFLRQQQWADFKVQYNKEYATVEEEAYRFQVFKDNLARAAQLNLENPEATFGVTPFVDLDPVEFKRLYLGYRPEIGSAAVERLSRPVNYDAPAASPNANVDWRTSGAVSPVKDQGQCGSCWAFSAVEGVESAWFLKHGTLPTLSPQQVVSCDKTDAGCNGGDLPTAFAYIKSNGLEPESTYPYSSGSSGATGTCKYSSSAATTKITGFTYATPPCTGACSNQDEATLLNNLASTGPSSICVYADSWQTYVSGVITSTTTCPYSYYSLDHCVQLVGYQAATTNYWIVRNSWGTSWGQKGYIYLGYGKNVCGVADEATFATSA